MINIKAFEDGPRYVIVLEGIEKPKAESIVRDLLSGIVNAEVEQISPSEALPVPESIVPEISVVDTFQDGPYAGLKPMELVRGENVEQELGYGYLRKEKEDGGDLALRKEIDDALCAYMADKLKDADPESYANRLIVKHLNMFLNKFSCCIPDEIKKDEAENVCKGFSFDALSDAPEGILRKVIADVIIKTREYAKSL